MSEEIKVIKIDDYTWIATPLTIEDTRKWYIDYCGIEDDCCYSFDEIEVCDLEKGCMWYPTNDEKDIEHLGSYDEVYNSEYHKTKKHSQGDLQRIEGDVYKFTSFKDVLSKHIENCGEITEPFEIASTEW